MSTTVEELQARTEEYEQRAREADPKYWQTKAGVTRANAEQAASDLDGERKAVRVAGAKISEEYAGAKAEMIEAVRAYIEVKNDYRAAKLAYTSARSTAIALGETIPMMGDLALDAQSDYELKKLLDAHLTAIHLNL